jgi:hopene-associated glycosyltransferase HpnB
MLVDALAVAAFAAWLAVLLLPAQAWRTRERLEPFGAPNVDADLGAVTVLIPARNEAAALEATIASLAAQGRQLRVVVIDDQSSDATATIARRAADQWSGVLDLAVINGQALPPGWGGKLWALEQGLREVSSAFCLLLDAEIRLGPGTLAALLEKANAEGRAMVSVMARLHCATIWERLLVPPFIYFFKLLYPFARVNAPASRVAAAAGGCILIRTEALRAVGGFAAIADALIDDCTLAAKIKGSGRSIWLGLSEHIASTRIYADLTSFRRMVTRTAFTQLRYSLGLLILVTALMLVVFVAPWVGVTTGRPWGRIAGIGGIVAMSAAFWPVVRFYRLSPAWVATLSVAALLFLAMTIESAIRYWRGIRAEWKGRTYASRS